MNGAALSDINNDGMMDLIAVSYTLTFGAGIDSIYLNAYNLNVPYSPERVLWSTYKGNNTRNGLLTPQMVSSAFEQEHNEIEIRVSPNPASQQAKLAFSLPQAMPVMLTLTDANGKIVTQYPEQQLPSGEQQLQLPLNNLPAGLYWISVWNGQRVMGTVPLLIQP